MKLYSGKIMKVLNKHNGIPKHLDMWNMNITYYRDDIIEGRSAFLFYNDNAHVTTTSFVEKIEEDENNLVLTTCYSKYFIKKII